MRGSLYPLGSGLGEEEGWVSLAGPVGGQRGPICRMSQSAEVCVSGAEQASGDASSGPENRGE